MDDNKRAEIMARLEKAYDLISTIPVAGDAVDKMAVARQELRRAHEALTAEGEGADG